MSVTPQLDSSSKRRRRRRTSAHYRALLRQTVARHILWYFLPLVLLAVFFNVQYANLVTRSTQAHLGVIAEHQASTMDLFLQERLVNLANLIDDPAGRYNLGSPSFLREALTRLRQTSEAFVDLGYVDGDGRLVAYSGPINYDRPISYASEPWFQALMGGDEDSVITDIYLGFRGQPHFTIAVRRQLDRGGARILRSALSPEWIETYLTTLEGASEVHVAVVNDRGVYQVAPQQGAPLEPSSYRPPREPSRGYVEDAGQDQGGGYGYAWLSQTPWALVVSPAAGGSLNTGAFFMGEPRTVLLVTLGLFVLMGVVIVIRSHQLTVEQIRFEEHEAELSGQLVQAAKLASVGELAAGVAHEINNPLAIIAEEVGLLKDSLDPELSDDDDVDLGEALDIIHDAVFRCRDITRKLLTFVRQTDVEIETHTIEEILDEVVGGIMGKSLSLSNVEVATDYDDRVPPLLTDKNRLIQVFVNLVKNAEDAMPDGGTLTVSTRHQNDRVVVKVKDTGCGMTPSQLEKVFMPFFTTKDPGQGTGLGLSVCSSIVEGLGGQIFAESQKGRGSTFSVVLPYALDR